MPLTSQQLVAALGAGKGVGAIATEAGVPLATVQDLWQQLTAGKVPPANAALQAGVSARVEVVRDGAGVPHVYAENEPDLFFGLGFAMAQDRLWQMDYMRRKAYGRLAEILGESYFDQDYMYRILGFDLVCNRNYYLMGDRWRQVVDGMAAGINRAIDQAAENLPVEFDILGYRPERWSPIDILVGLRYQWWGLSGRLAQITGSTILERELGERVDEFTRMEKPKDYIVPARQNRGEASGTPAPVRDTLNFTDHPFGSNNWVIGGAITKSGKPLLANDPHYAYEHGHGLFYTCHLHGGGHTEAGTVFIGTPGMMTGLNDRIAWGFTNNGTTIRDLYAEELDPGDPGRYRQGDGWVPLTTRTVQINVKGKGAVRKVIRCTARGPIVSDIVARVTDAPLSLRWVGFEPIDDVRALLEMNTAFNRQEWRAALRNFACSVTNFIYADVENHIGYQMTARIPLRKVATTGIRPAGHPDHQWQGYIPFDSLPRIEDPDDSIIVTANNRPVAPDYPWPLYGAYAGGTRYHRIHALLASQREHDAAGFCRMQFDSKALIAEEVTPRVIAALRASNDGALAKIADLLAKWDFTSVVDAVQPAIYEMFMDKWTQAYAAATLPDQPDVRGAAGPAARRALVGEENLLPSGELDRLIVASMGSTLQALRQGFGDDAGAWAWGKLHYIAFPHPLGHIGGLGEVLNGPKFPCAGGQNTINNVAPSHKAPFVADSGPTYRLIADLSNTASVLVNNVSPTSGHPGSPHYADSTRAWANGEYHTLHRVRKAVEAEAEGTTVITPLG